MNLRTISFLLFISVPVLVGSYALFLLWIEWPITDLSVSSAGLFGDSFGILTSLFSGLAFSGLIITVLLQKDELRLQRLELRESRIEFKKGAEAQEKNAQLSALSAMLNEYKSQIAFNQEIIDRTRLQVVPVVTQENPLEAENLDLIRRKSIIIFRIEKILQESGVNLAGT